MYDNGVNQHNFPQPSVKYIISARSYCSSYNSPGVNALYLIIILLKTSHVSHPSKSIQLLFSLAQDRISRQFPRCIPSLHWHIGHDKLHAIIGLARLEFLAEDTTIATADGRGAPGGAIVLVTSRPLTMVCLYTDFKSWSPKMMLVWR